MDLSLVISSTSLEVGGISSLNMFCCRPPFFCMCTMVCSAPWPIQDVENLPPHSSPTQGRTNNIATVHVQPVVTQNFTASRSSSPSSTTYMTYSRRWPTSAAAFVLNPPVPVAWSGGIVLETVPLRRDSKDGFPDVVGVVGGKRVTGSGSTSLRYYSTTYSISKNLFFLCGR